MDDIHRPVPWWIGGASTDRKEHSAIVTIQL